MNKTIKIASILLLLFVIINSSAAIKIVETHIHGMKSVTVTQDDKFTLHIQVVYDGPCREKGITMMPCNCVHLYINDLSGREVKHYDVRVPRAWGNDITVDTSDLKPGLYEMEASFDGMYFIGMAKCFRPSSKIAPLTVLPKNGTLKVPTAYNMYLSTTINKSYEGDFNVTDVNNGILNAVLVYTPKHGKITVDGTHFVYTPDPGFEGKDTFMYRVIEDSRLISSDHAKVNMFVLKDNMANNMSINTTINKPYEGTFNATGPYDRPLNAFLVSTPNHGRVSINGTNFVYTPNFGYVGNDTFSYKVNCSNGLVSDVARVDVQVVDNRLNVTAENLTKDMSKNTNLQMDIYPRYGCNVVLVQLPLHGNATVENTMFDYPRIYYTPFKDYVGNDTFSYRLQSPDGKISNTAWINIRIWE